MQDKEKNLLAELTSQMSSEIKIPDELMKEAEQMQGLLLYYSYAIKEIRTKLEILNDELAFRTRRNPIESIESRVKKPASIIEKLRRKNYPVSVESIFENLHDVAGVRVICSFIEDIYDVADMFLKQDDITLVEIKDYIKNPNLPEGRVTAAAVSAQAHSVIEALQSAKICVMPVEPCLDLPEGIASHADLQLLHLGGNSVLTASCSNECENLLRAIGMDIKKADAILGGEYPEDCALNAEILGKNIILNPDATDKKLLEYIYTNNMDCDW